MNAKELKLGIDYDGNIWCNDHDDNGDRFRPILSTEGHLTFTINELIILVADHLREFHNA